MATATEAVIPVRSVATTPHFSVNRADLVRELSLAIGAVERKTSIPILGNVKLEASDFGHLAITATDLEIGMSCRCAADVKKPGIATLPAKRLLEYVRLLPEGSIDISFADNQWATIKAGRSKTRIAGMSVEGFPELPSPRETFFSIPVKSLAKMIQQTSYAISMEESRFTLNGTLVEIADGTARMIATDGHRLAISNGSADSRITGKYLIPRKALMEFSRLAGAVAADTAVEFSIDENHLFLSIGDRLLLARKMTGSFPEYARVLPASFAGSATLDRKQLRDAISRVRNFADERSRAIRMIVSENQVAVFAQAMETGESDEAISAEVSGSVTIGLNANYLLDFLGATDAERVTLSFNDAKSAMQLSPVGDERNVCVVMPLRI